MHPAIPIAVMAALIAWLGDDKEPPTQKRQAAAEKVVLLPDVDGNAGALVVTTANAEVVLERAYAGAAVYAQGRIERSEEDALAVQKSFSAALDARPPRPISFTVYFEFDRDVLTAESLAQFNRIKAELAARPAPEIIVVGHTDRVGAVEYNDALSLRRAEIVRAALIATGIAPTQIESAGRGEREPAVATPDEVAEARNRRVEITVR
jgi:outer membrane protein OmpA-like peptidoglycan-associated protein